MGPELHAGRAFVAVVDAGRFREAAARLSITQQAVSKRVAALEKSLGVRLFTRTARGAHLTIDGQAFLPHARDLLRAAERAAASVRPGRRALRVDVIGRRLAPAALPRDFHRAHPGIELDVVALFDADTAIAAVRSGSIDASFRAVTLPARQFPDAIHATRVLNEPVQFLTGPAHELATARAVTPARLAGHRIWMPRIVSGTEWAAFYDDLAAAFGLTIEATGPDFGTEPLLDNDRRLSDAGDLLRPADPSRLARRPRPAACRPARPHTGLPALPDLARRQPAPRTHRTPRPPRHRAPRPPDVDTDMGGDADHGRWMTPRTPACPLCPPLTTAAPRHTSVVTHVTGTSAGWGGGVGHAANTAWIPSPRPRG